MTETKKTTFKITQAEFIKMMMKRVKVSRDDLAEELGVAPGTITYTLNQPDHPRQEAIMGLLHQLDPAIPEIVPDVIEIEREVCKAPRLSGFMWRKIRAKHNK